MEPKKDGEAYGNLPNRFTSERIKEIVEVDVPVVAEKQSFPTSEHSVATERTPLSELQKLEMKDNQAITSAGNQAVSANDPAFQSVSATVDPQDQLTRAQIEENKKGPIGSALTWLAIWWDRQLKQLGNKKIS